MTWSYLVCRTQCVCHRAQDTVHMTWCVGHRFCRKQCFLQTLCPIPNSVSSYTYSLWPTQCGQHPLCLMPTVSHIHYVPHRLCPTPSVLHPVCPRSCCCVPTSECRQRHNGAHSPIGPIDKEHKLASRRRGMTRKSRNHSQEYSTLLYGNTLLCTAVQNSAFKYNVVQFSTLCSTVQCKTVQYSLVQYNVLL